GIRDDLVTGVQTCALPIYRDRLLDRRLVRREHSDPAVVLDVDLGARLLLDSPHDLAAGADDLADLLLTDLDRDEPGRVGAELGRSEERRVGKDWSCGGGRE